MFSNSVHKFKELPAGSQRQGPKAGQIYVKMYRKVLTAPTPSSNKLLHNVVSSVMNFPKIWFSSCLMAVLGSQSIMVQCCHPFLVWSIRSHLKVGFFNNHAPSCDQTLFLFNITSAEPDGCSGKKTLNR